MKRPDCCDMVCQLYGWRSSSYHRRCLPGWSQVGQGGTTLWRLCSLDFDTTVAVFFEITASGGAQAADPSTGGAPQFYLQFITKYLHWSGELRCRVTTVTRRWTEGANSADIIAGGRDS